MNGATSPGPLSVWEALGEEHWELAGSQPDPEYQAGRERYLRARDACRANPDDQAAGAQYQAAEKEFRDLIMRLLHQANRSALCFSGGGIRSATFGLGVLHGLASHSWREPQPGAAEQPPALLSEFHYVSTVSGGGYLGSWFSGWARRVQGGAADVLKALASTPLDKLDPEPKPLRHLRRFSNYLNPRLGILSADTWTLAATVARNILLNWLVLLPLLAAVLIIPRIALAITGLGTEDVPAPAWLLQLGFWAGALSTAYLVYDLPSAGNAGGSQGRFLWLFLLPVGVSASALTLYWAWHVEGGYPLGVWTDYAKLSTGMLGAGIALGAPFAIRSRGSVNWAWVARAVMYTLATGVATGWLGYQAALALTDPALHAVRDLQLYVCISVPALLGIFVIGQALLVGLTSRIMEDEDREWWARASAWLLIVLLSWLLFSSVVLYGPRGLLALKSLVTAALGGIVSRLGFSPRTTAGRREEEEGPTGRLPASRRLAEWAIKLALPVLLVLLVMSLATLNDELRKLLPSGVLYEFALAAALAGAALLAARFIDANKFSLNAMYRARLIRAFPGASNMHRDEHQFTGFDPSDDMPMQQLATSLPLHVVNIALNLVKGENLAWQQRKAESFTVSRLHSGSCRVGYQPSAQYAGEHGITLGEAVTISGAAASPNMGYHSSALLTLIMTLFNARLGAWLPNPGEPGRGLWRREGPTYAVRPFVDEAFGLTTDQNAWVYLSDGGHFENLGLYEMVLRRCRTIVVVDASADPKFNFEDLGNAVRKIRVDMGIAIEFPDGIPISGKREKTGKHCAIGRIEYSCVDGPAAEDGVLLYIKPSLNQNEPADVANYAALNTEFPHQSTGDQWFDEPQFESYRRLGFHIVDEICEAERPGGARTLHTLAGFVRQAREQYLGLAATAATP